MAWSRIGHPTDVQLGPPAEEGRSRSDRYSGQGAR